MRQGAVSHFISGILLQSREGNILKMIATALKQKLWLFPHHHQYIFHKLVNLEQKNVTL